MLIKKLLFILLILTVAIGAVSLVSAENLDNATLTGDEDFTDVDSNLQEAVLNTEGISVGGDCDHVNDETPSQLFSNSITVINEEAHNSIPAKIQISQSGSYYNEKTLTVKVIGEDNKCLYSIPVTLKFSNGKSATVITQKNGKSIYKLPFNPGKYSVNAKVTSNILNVNDTKLKNIKIEKAPAKITMKKLSTSFRAKKYFKIKVINSKTNKAIGGVKLLVKVYTNGKAKRMHVTTNSKGIAKFKTSNLNVGNHKVKVKEVSSAVKAKAKTSKIKVGKASTSFLNEIGAVYIKKVEKYNVALFNKNTEKSIKGVKLTVKIDTGKKIKKYVVKTGKYGADIDLSYLGLGRYKVTVSFDGSAKYKKCTGSDYIDVLSSAGQILFD